MMMNGNTNSDYTKSAYGASSNSGSSEKRRKSCDRKHMKTKKSKSCGNKKKKKDKDNKPKKNTCPHCKKYHRKKSHCIEPDKCMWNIKYKGYRFNSICNELEVDFKPRIKFTADFVGILKNGYVRNVPLPRAPRIQSTSHVTNQPHTDTCYSQESRVPMWCDLFRSLAGLGSNILPFSPVWLM